MIVKNRRLNHKVGIPHEEMVYIADPVYFWDTQSKEADLMTYREIWYKIVVNEGDSTRQSQELFHLYCSSTPKGKNRKQNHLNTFKMCILAVQCII